MLEKQRENSSYELCHLTVYVLLCSCSHLRRRRLNKTPAHGRAIPSSLFIKSTVLLYPFSQGIILGSYLLLSCNTLAWQVEEFENLCSILCVYSLAFALSFLKILKPCILHILYQLRSSWQTCKSHYVYALFYMFVATSDLCLLR